ncbi:MAG: hypothetical protein IKZ58_03970 [Selenomonadaceae bacterium]|nr:hypothetical protein [Selenomonadaceae bacterium]
MSLGYGGFCRKFVEDDSFVIYEYFSYNFNEERFYNDEKIFDGFITIRKSSLIEPILHEKIKKLPNGRRKKFTKKILVDFSVDELLNAGNIEIKNCSHTWKTLPNGLDFISYKLCRKIFLYYQNNGKLPEKLGWDV